MPDNDKQSYQVDKFSELGASGLWRTGGFVIDDILPQLRGKQAQTAFRDMSENDPIVGSILFAIERVVLQVDWRVDPYDDNTGDTPTAYDIEVADFFEEVRNDMSHSWHELITAILTFLPYGWSFFEIVYKRRKGPNQKDPVNRSKFSDNKIGWRKIVMRAQDSLWQWQFDEGGGVKAMIQRDPTTGRLNVIPIEKSLLFRTNSSRGNPEGRALDPSTPIPTPDGWRKLEELNPGDQVLDENARARNIVARQDWIDRPRYCLGFADGTEIVADANHLWVTTTFWERKHDVAPQTRTTEEIVTTLRDDHVIIGAKGKGNHSIISTEKLENGPTVCIEVDSPSHLFLAGDAAVPTHNSVLRSAFKSWYYKRRIEEFEAVGIERDLAGLPVATVPPEWMASNASPAEQMALQAMERIVRGVKRNEAEGIILPAIFDESNNPIVTFKLMNSGGARQFQTSDIINRYNNQIAMTVLADFIMLGHENVGSFALGASKVDLFIAAVETWVRLIAETFNSHAIPRLMSLNGFDTSRCPTLTYGQVNAVDLQELGAFLLNLSGAQLITPDNNLEDFLRELAGLPTFRPEANGIAVNTRYGDDEMERPANVMDDEDVPFIGANQPANGGGGDATTSPKNSRTPQGNKAKNDQTGGSDLQANITSAGYPGQAKGKKTPSGADGPLVNNQRSTT